eukprot:scpid91465/ scgid3740/ 
MGEPTKLLCSLPGIEQNVASLLQTLTTFVSESRDRERCLLRRLDELSAQIVELKEEVCVSFGSKYTMTVKVLLGAARQYSQQPAHAPFIVPAIGATVEASSRKQLERTWRPYPVASLSKRTRTVGPQARSTRMQTTLSPLEDVDPDTCQPSLCPTQPLHWTWRPSRMILGSWWLKSLTARSE